MGELIRRLACGLALFSVLSVVGGCSGDSRGSDIAGPPPAAPPERIARIYLHAAVTGDCKLTSQLTLTGGTWSWCTDPKLLAYRSVGEAYRWSSAGRHEECVGFQMATHGSSDGTMPVGWQPWELCFVRTRAGWRLNDQGQG